MAVAAAGAACKGACAFDCGRAADAADVSSDPDMDAARDPGDASDKPVADDGVVADVACSPGLTPCLDEDGVVRCAALRNDPCHCGSCAMQCGAYCFGGYCGDCPGLSACGPPRPCLTGVYNGAYWCVDCQRDPANCPALCAAVLAADAGP